MYLKNRKSLGYNVIQVVLLYTLPNRKGIQSAMSVYEKNIFDKSYFDFADKIIGLAKKYGIYVALLPTWGSFFKEKILDESNVEQLAEFVVKKFSHNDNLI